MTGLLIFDLLGVLVAGPLSWVDTHHRPAHRRRSTGWRLTLFRGEPTMPTTIRTVTVPVHPVELSDRLVPDELWAAIAPVLPTAPCRPQGGGRRRHEDRAILTAIVYLLTSGASWRQVPPWCAVTPATAYRRFREWTNNDVWRRLLLAYPDDDWCQIVVERALLVAHDATSSRFPDV